MGRSSRAASAAYGLAQCGEWNRAAEGLWQAARESTDAEDRWRLAGRAAIAAVHARDFELARGILRGVRELPGAAFPPHVAAGAAMLELLVEGDALAADRTIRTALGALDPLVDPDEVTELLAALHVAPLAPSERQLDTFEALVATAWVRRARGDLRVVGDLTRIALNSAEPLTAQESRVAHLAAYGLSNKDIGERLFLSPRTVSGHLYRLFPKLGITSRAGLRDALQRRDDETVRAMDAG